MADPKAGFRVICTFLPRYPLSTSRKEAYLVGFYPHTICLNRSSLSSGSFMIMNVKPTGCRFYPCVSVSLLYLCLI